MSSTRNADHIANLVDRQGFKAPEESDFRKVDFRGKRVSKAKVSKENLAKGGVLGILERAGRVLGGAVASVGTLGSANISKTFREATWEAGIKGVVQRTLYLETGNTDSKTAKIREFDPKNRASIVRYLENPKNKENLRETPEGHQYLPFTSKSGFIFVPNGEIKKATYIKLWDNKSGKPIRNQTEFYRATRSYCILYEDIQKGLDTESKRITNLLVEKNLGNRTVEQIRKKMSTVVINTRGRSVRIYTDKMDPNKKMGYFSGTAIEIKDNAWKELDRLHDKERGARHTEALDPKERPFMPPKHPRPPANDGYDSDDDGDDNEASLIDRRHRSQSTVQNEEPDDAIHVPGEGEGAGALSED